MGVKQDLACNPESRLNDLPNFFIPRLAYKIILNPKGLVHTLKNPLLPQGNANRGWLFLDLMSHLSRA